MTPPPASFLLIDADSHGLETLTYGFEREGLKVTRSSELARAAQLAATGSPAGAIVALHTLTEDALKVVAQLRRARSDLPILALGPAPVQAAATMAGATDFLRGPSFIRDVVAVARLGLLARKAAEAGGRATGEGDLRLSEYRGLFFLLRALSACGRSALVTMARGNRRAELRIYQGGLVAANVAALQSLPALHHALLWEEAALTIKLQPIPKHTMMTMTAQEVLDESERFLRDFAHGVRDLGAADTLYVVAAAAKRMQLPGLQMTQVAPLLRLFDGKRVLADVVSESPFRIFDTVRMIRRLRDAGALVMRDEKRGAGQSMLAEWAMTPDPRGVVGDRRRTSRSLRPVGLTPAPLPMAPMALTMTPAPTPLPTPAPTRAPARTKETPHRGTTVVGMEPVGGTAPAPDPAPADLLPATPVPTSLAGAPNPAPIQLTQRKATAAGEIAAPLRRETPAAVLAVAPTIQVKLAPDGTPLTQAQAPAVAATPAALAAHDSEPPPARLTAPSEPPPERPVPSPELGPPPERMLIPPEPRPLSEPLMPPEPTAPPPRQKTPIPLSVRSKSGPRELTPGPRNRPPSGPHGTFDDVEADFFAREADLYKREAVETFEDLDHPLVPVSARKRRKK